MQSHLSYHIGRQNYHRKFVNYQLVFDKLETRITNVILCHIVGSVLAWQCLALLDNRSFVVPPAAFSTTLRLH